MKVLNEEKLKDLLKYIETYATSNDGRTPSHTAIMQHMGMPSTTAYRYMTELAKRGYVTYNGKGTLTAGANAFTPGATIPLIGQIVCGKPSEEEEYIERYVSVPKDWVQGECFLLRAYGDSMIDIGIAKGDLILVRKTSEATDGQVVVALTEEGNTLKRLFWEDGRPRLHAENSSYTPEERDFYPTELTIQGVVLKVIKDVR